MAKTTNSHTVTTSNLNTTAGYNTFRPIPQRLFVDDMDIGQELQEARKIKKQFNALYKLLIQKGIFSEQEIEDLINATDLMDEMSKE